MLCFVACVACRSNVPQADADDIVIDGAEIRVGRHTLRLGDHIKDWELALGKPRAPIGNPQWPGWGIQVNEATTADERIATERFAWVIHIDFADGIWPPPEGVDRRVFVGDTLIKSEIYDDLFYWTSLCTLWRYRERFHSDYECEHDDLLMEMYLHRGKPAKLSVYLQGERLDSIVRKLVPARLPPLPPPTPKPYVDYNLPKRGADMIRAREE
jgi:hypothetical protein